MADIFLNICVVLSNLKKHKDALDAALNAIFLIQEELIDHILPNFFTSLAQKAGNKRVTMNIYNDNDDLRKPNQTTLTHVKDDSPSLGHSGTRSDFVVDRIRVLVIAYHNMGAELEHLHLYDDAFRVYEKGHKLASSYLGEDESIRKDLETILEMLGARIKIKQRASSLQQYKISAPALKTEKYFARGTYKENLSINISHGDIPEGGVMGYTTDRQKRPSNNKLNSSSVAEQIDQAMHSYTDNMSRLPSRVSRSKKSDAPSNAFSMKFFYPKSTLKSRILKNGPSFAEEQNDPRVSRNTVSFRTNGLLSNENAREDLLISQTPIEKKQKIVFEQNAKELEFRKSQTVPLNAEVLQLQKFHAKMKQTYTNKRDSQEEQRSKVLTDQDSSSANVETNPQPKSGSKHSFNDFRKSKQAIDNSYTSEHDYTEKSHTLVSAPSSFGNNFMAIPKKIGSNPVLHSNQKGHARRPVFNHYRYLQAKNQPAPIDERPEESMMTNNLTLAQSSCDSQIDPEIQMDHYAGSPEASKLENSEFRGDISTSKRPYVRQESPIGLITVRNSASPISKEVVQSLKNSRLDLEIHRSTQMIQNFQKQKTVNDLIPDFSKDFYNE